jgi:protoporphyrinogen oxidase
MPFNELAKKITPSLDKDTLNAAKSLVFRDFITVALVIDKPFISEDTWVYTHDVGLRSIRFQNFRNWSPYMVPNDSETVIGLEYTCTFNDDFWSLSDDELAVQGKKDFLRLGFANESDIKDVSVVRLRNVYPVYKLGYGDKVDLLRNKLFQIENLYPLGRGGIHRYNNSDHSMMTAFLTVKNVMEGKRVFDVFKVNQDAVYHEEN